MKRKLWFAFLVVLVLLAAASQAGSIHGSTGKADEKAPANSLTFGNKANSLGIKSTFSYTSSSLNVIQGQFKYGGAKCYVNKVWMRNPASQIRKVSTTEVNANYTPVNKVNSDKNRLAAYAKAKNTSKANLIKRMTGVPVIAIGAEDIKANDTLAVENGEIVLERVKYSNSQPKHSGISFNASGVTPFFDVWRENVFDLNPSFTICAYNKYDTGVLIQDGKKVKGKATDRAPRTVFGRTKGGEYITLTVSGKGLTLNDLKSVCMKFDMSWAFNLSGGANSNLSTIDPRTGKLKTTCGADGSKCYSMLYFTEYDKAYKVRRFSTDVADAKYPPFESQYLKFTLTAPSNNHVNLYSNRINPEFGKQLERVAKYLGATKKDPLVIYSGFRTTELQRKNWVKAWANGKGKYKVSWRGWLMNKYTGKEIVAPPGQSVHQTGNAVDIPYTGIAGKLRKFEKSSPKQLKNDFSIWRPIRHEYHHFEIYLK